MSPEGIVVGQKVKPIKLQRARELRSQMTEEERILWQSLRANRLRGLHFRRQQIIDGFIADFYCHAAGLVVEVDGGVHEAQVELDAERDRVIAARGLRVLRVRAEDVRRDLPAVLARIAAHAPAATIRTPPSRAGKGAGGLGPSLPAPAEGAPQGLRGQGVRSPGG